MHNYIVGGAHTYSKGDDQFPLLSPAAISRGKGSAVWDIDGNKYIDCALGLGSVGIGHSDFEISKEVIKEVKKGSANVEELVISRSCKAFSTYANPDGLPFVKAAAIMYVPASILSKTTL